MSFVLGCVSNWQENKKYKKLLLIYLNITEIANQLAESKFSPKKLNERLKLKLLVEAS